jgi:hypothetical protein
MNHKNNKLGWLVAFPLLLPDKKDVGVKAVAAACRSYKRGGEY